MKLIWVDLAGYRRFEGATMNVDGKIIAIVGPNESGKSSFLSALASLSNTSPLARSDLTRGAPPADKTMVIRARFLLEADDLTAAAIAGVVFLASD